MAIGLEGNLWRSNVAEKVFRGMGSRFWRFALITCLKIRKVGWSLWWGSEIKVEIEIEILLYIFLQPLFSFCGSIDLQFLRPKNTDSLWHPVQVHDYAPVKNFISFKKLERTTAPINHARKNIIQNTNKLSAATTIFRIFLLLYMISYHFIIFHFIYIFYSQFNSLQLTVLQIEITVQ